MRIFAQDRRKLWVLLPALGLMLFASAARAVVQLVTGATVKRSGARRTELI